MGEFQIKSFSAVVMLQLTLAVLKPDIFIHTARRNRILQVIKNNGFNCLRSKKIWLSNDQVGKFYEMHKGKFFYERLITFMSSGYLMAMVLERENAITHWRQILGPTSPYKARQSAPDSIRALYGISDTRNVAHGSDSDETAQREIGILLPDFDYDEWKSQLTLQLQNNDRYLYDGYSYDGY